MPLFSLLLAVSFALAGEQPATTIQVGVTVTVPTSMEMMEMPDVPKEQAPPVAVNGKFMIIKSEGSRESQVVANVIYDAAAPLSACLGSFDLGIKGTFFVRNGVVSRDSLQLTYDINPNDPVISDEASACVRTTVNDLHFPSTVEGASVYFYFNHKILGD